MLLEVVNIAGTAAGRLTLRKKVAGSVVKKKFFAVLQDYPEYQRFVISGKDDQGFLQFSCTWLTDDGLCRDHTNRLALCTNFPDKGLYFCGGALPPGCGYAINEVRPFSRYLADVDKKKAGL